MSRELRHRRDRRAQLGVVALAVLAGVVAGWLGTRRTWERVPGTAPPASTTTSVPSPIGAKGRLP